MSLIGHLRELLRPSPPPAADDRALREAERMAKQREERCLGELRRTRMELQRAGSDPPVIPGLRTIGRALDAQARMMQDAVKTADRAREKKGK